MKWRIYYGDEQVFDNSMGSPSQAPSTNVQAIVCVDGSGNKKLYHSWDWYYFNGEEWRGCDVHGLLDQLLNDINNNICGVKQGRTIKDDIYDKILARAINDKNFKQDIKNKLEKPKQAYGGA